MTIHLIKDYDYLRYNFGDYNVDFKTTDVKYLVKIIDYGDAVKYSEPVILNRYILYNNSFADYFNYIYDWICVFQEDFKHDDDKSPFWLKTKSYFLQMDNFILCDDDKQSIDNFKIWWKIHKDILIEIADQLPKNLKTLTSDGITKIRNAIKNRDDETILNYIKKDTHKITRLLASAFLNTDDTFPARNSTNFDLRTLNDRKESVFELIKQPFFKKIFFEVSKRDDDYLVIG